MKNTIVKVTPISYFVCMALCLEIIERAIDTFLGDGDNQVTHFKINVMNAILQGYLLLLCFMWLPEVWRKIRNQPLSKKNIFEEYPVTTLFSVILPVIFFIDFCAAQWLWRHQAQENAAKVKSYRMPHNYYHHTLQPKKVVQETWGDASYTLITNSLGFKDSDTTTILPTSNKRRIVFIGDSFTEGIGLPFEKTFVGRIRQTYQDSLEILGAGCVSYSPKLYYYKIKYLLEKEKLQINDLFLFIDISDIQDETTYESFVPIHEQVATKAETLPATTQPIWYDDLLEFWAKGSAVGYIIYQRYTKNVEANFATEYYNERGKWTYDKVVYEKWGAKGIQSARRYVQLLLELCKQHQISLTIVVYPWTEQLKVQDWNSKQVVIWKDFAATHQINCINFFPIFQTLHQEKGYDKVYESYYIEGDVHWNEEGHRIIADELIKYLQNVKKTPN